jgi:hypothetical protein
VLKCQVRRKRAIKHSENAPENQGYWKLWEPEIHAGNADILPQLAANRLKLCDNLTVGGKWISGWLGSNNGFQMFFVDWREWHDDCEI